MIRPGSSQKPQEPNTGSETTTLLLGVSLPAAEKRLGAKPGSAPSKGYDCPGQGTGTGN